MPQDVIPFHAGWCQIGVKRSGWEAPVVAGIRRACDALLSHLIGVSLDEDRLAHGYDGAKKLNGRTRHFLVYTTGLLLRVGVQHGNNEGYGENLSAERAAGSPRPTNPPYCINPLPQTLAYISILAVFFPTPRGIFCRPAELIGKCVQDARQ